MLHNVFRWQQTNVTTFLVFVLYFGWGITIEKFLGPCYLGLFKMIRVFQNTKRVQAACMLYATEAQV